MTREQLSNLAQSIDPANAEYILGSRDIEEKRAWSEKSKYKEMNEEEIEKIIRDYDRLNLTPANAKVGDGATVVYYTDRHAGTIVKVTKATITIRRDKAIRDPNFKPEWIPGGFSAVCLNSNDQKWSYEPDLKGALTTLHWSRRYNRYGQPGNLTASKGRHEHYDYNF